MAARSDLTAPIRLAVISAICAAREGLCVLLEHRDGGIVVADQSDPSPEAIASLSESAVAVVLIDGSCRESLAGLPRIRQTLPGAVVVVYGVQPIREVLLACARNGATVVASHDTTADALVELVRRAANGHLGGEAQLNATLLEELALGTHFRAAEISALTRREREVALALAGGLTNKEIAQRFSISLPTVKSHVHCILRKLGVGRREQVLPRLRDSAAA